MRSIAEGDADVPRGEQGVAVERHRLHAADARLQRHVVDGRRVQRCLRPETIRVEVNGTQAHPLWQWLKAQAPGVLGTEAIKWNFTKFLVGRDGSVLKRYAPGDTPASLRADIERALAA